MLVSIYALIDPTTLECRYIGKSRSVADRHRDHVANYLKVNTHKTNWVNGLARKGFKPEMVILEEVPTADWPQHEQFWIAYFKYMGAALTNSTTGGEGGEFTADIRLKLSAKAKAQWADPARRPARGKASPERRTRQSESAKQLLTNPVVRAKRIIQLREAANSPGRLDNLRKSAKNPVVQARKSAASKLWAAANPEKCAANVARMHTPSAIAKHAETLQREDVRKQMSESAKKRWARSGPEIVAAQNVGRRRYAAEHIDELHERIKHTQTPEAIANFKAAMLSDEVRRKMSESAKKRWAKDRDNIIALQNEGKRNKKKPQPSPRTGRHQTKRGNK